MFFKCPIENCEKLFNCKKALKEHERTHNNNRPFKWYVFQNIETYHRINNPFYFYNLAPSAIRPSLNTHLYKNMRASMTRPSHIAASFQDVNKRFHRFQIWFVTSAFIQARSRLHANFAIRSLLAVATWSSICKFTKSKMAGVISSAFLMVAQKLISTKVVWKNITLFVTKSSMKNCSKSQKVSQ